MNMVSGVSLKNIVDANWDRQYLTSTGQVENRGFCARIIKILRNVPYIGNFVSNLFPKADIFKASAAIKATITELLVDGANPDDTLIQSAAKKVNDLVYHIAAKHPEQTTEWPSALIHTKALITTTQPQLQTENSDSAAKTPVALITPEVEDHVIEEQKEAEESNVVEQEEQVPSTLLQKDAESLSFLNDDLFEEVGEQEIPVIIIDVEHEEIAPAKEQSAEEVEVKKPKVHRTKRRHHRSNKNSESTSKEQKTAKSLDAPQSSSRKRK